MRLSSVGRAALASVLVSGIALAHDAEFFPDGVASGDVTSTRAVLWTRTSEPAVVTLELSENDGFAKPIRQVTATTVSGGLTAKLTLQFLKPDQQYFYRWVSGESVSDVGRFRTAPIPWTDRDLRLVFAGDSDATNINGQPARYDFKALATAQDENPDFFVYLGDIVYTDSGERGEAGRAKTLDEFREAYQAGRQIPALRNLLQSTSVYPVWDDHEVANDWDPTTVDTGLFRKGRQVFLESLPMTDPIAPIDSTCIDQPFFRYVRWGAAADFLILDERSCRSAEVGDACLNESGDPDKFPTLPSPYRVIIGFPGSPPPGCLEAINDPSRTMIGETQKWLLKYYLLYSTARFKFIVNEVPIIQYFGLPYDRWEGYAAERAEILKFIRDNGIENVIFLTADAHANMMDSVALDRFDDPQPVAFEFVSGPIGTKTLAKEVEETYGIGESLLNQAFELSEMNCWDLNRFGYGVVDVDAGAGTARVTLKDENGAVIQSKGASGAPCTMNFGP